MFRGVLIDKHEGQQAAAVQMLDESSLPEGEVTVRVAYSTLNYKDAPALTGASPVVRHFPMVPGIDFAGTAVSSSSPAFQPGDAVALNGWAVGEVHWGGLAELAQPGKPLDKERWAGAVDVAGGQLLANVCAAMRYRGVVAACGLAAGMAWPATVAPFILRGVSLLGIDSVMAPLPDRLAAWQCLAEDLDPALLESLLREVTLDEVIALAPELLPGKIRGRLVVRVGAPA